MRLKHHTEYSIEFFVPPTKKAFIVLPIFPAVLFLFWNYLNVPVIFLVCFIGTAFAISSYRKAWGILDVSSDFIYLKYSTLFRRWEYECPLHQIEAFRIEKVGLGTYELVIDNATTFPFRWTLLNSPKTLVHLVSELDTFLHLEPTESEPMVHLPQHILPKKPKGTCKYCWGDVYRTPRFKNLLGQYAHQGCQDVRDEQRRNVRERD